MKLTAGERWSWRHCLRAAVAGLVLLSAGPAAAAGRERRPQPVRTWEVQEITLRAAGSFTDPYTDVDVWVELKGPGYERRVRGFWDGGDSFKVRAVASAPGRWTWVSGSNRSDSGLNGKTGSFEVTEWSEAERQANPNRRGFVRATANGHALCYADGTPFFLMADTWWSAGTRIWSWGSAAGAARISFHEAVAIRKRQGYNSIAMIASFPNWAEDGLGNNVKQGNVIIRAHGWKTQDMVDETGARPFALRGGPGSSADYDRLQPAYFQSLDRKMQHFAEQGFVPFFESVRRDHGQSWKAFTPDWQQSFARYLNYLVARYGAYNVIFSLLHHDWNVGTIPIEDWKAAIQTYVDGYGLPPFGQVTTALTDFRTDQMWGHGPAVPWLKLHGVGNAAPRNNRYAQAIFDQFNLDPPLPTLCQEPVYPGWGKPEQPLNDDYPPRSMAWTCVLQGGLAGHVYGSGFFDGKDGVDGLTAAGSDRLPVLMDFLLSEGRLYQDLIPARRLDSDRFEGSAVIARTADAALVMAYFQRRSQIASLDGLPPGRTYRAQWFDPRLGTWLTAGSGKITADDSGAVKLPDFPSDDDIANTDWALKLTASDR